VRLRAPTPATVLLLVLAGLVAACSGGGVALDAGAAANCRSAREVAAGAATRGANASVRWTVFGDSASHAVLDAWCAGVGAAVVQHAQAQPDAVESASDVVFISWNMARGAGELRRFIEDLRAGRHTEGQGVSSFVLLLQEVPRMGPEVPPQATLPRGVETSSARQLRGPSVTDIAAQAGLHLFYVPSMRAAPGEVGPVDHGTAILSSLPLRSHHAIELPMGIQRRVAVAAAIALPASGIPVHVATAHLDNFSLRRLAGSFGGIRARQARALARALPQDGAVVLGADLNTWARERREPAFRVLRARLGDPAEVGREPTSRFLVVPRRVDYLLASAPPGHEFTERRLSDRYGSDHHPLLGRLKLLEGRELR
jgi:endonuclease/exonuclease/phosphatase family metal-dependent hydrolase